jgi:hypothetical protein
MRSHEVYLQEKRLGVRGVQTKLSHRIISRPNVLVLRAKTGPGFEHVPPRRWRVDQGIEVVHVLAKIDGAIAYIMKPLGHRGLLQVLPIEGRVAPVVTVVRRPVAEDLGIVGVLPRWMIARLGQHKGYALKEFVNVSPFSFRDWTLAIWVNVLSG